MLLIMLSVLQQISEAIFIFEKCLKIWLGNFEQLYSILLNLTDMT